MRSDRFHVALTVAGRPVQDGWWSDEETARRKFVSWIGQYGDTPGARIALADQAAGVMLASWPGEG